MVSKVRSLESDAKRELQAIREEIPRRTEVDCVQELEADSSEQKEEQAFSNCWPTAARSHLTPILDESHGISL